MHVCTTLIHSLVVLVFSIIMLNLIAKHLSVKLAETVVINFVQFSCATEFSSGFHPAND